MTDLITRLLAYAKNQGGWHNIDDTCEEAADRIEALERAVDVARQIIEEIGLTASGCAATHGDSGGGLEMINGYAEDAFRVLSDALSPSGGEAA